MPIISEEDYLSHYGRKGMKWYQHIFGEEATSRKQERLAKKLHKQDVKASRAFNKAVRTEMEMKKYIDDYKRTGNKMSLMNAAAIKEKQDAVAKNLMKRCKAWNKAADKISKYTSDEGRKMLEEFKELHIQDISKIGTTVWGDNERNKKKN